MAVTALRSEERIGLGIALAAHAGLIALLLWRPPTAPVLPLPERIEVTISDDVGLTSTSPEPNAQAAPDVAPQLGEPAPAEAEPMDAAEPEPAPPEPAPKPEPKPQPRPEPRPQPKPQPRPAPKVEPPKPAPRPVPKAAPQPSPRPNPQPGPRPAPKAAAPKAAPKAASAAARPAAKAAPAPTAQPGGSRIGANFLEGVQGARSTGQSQAAPAAAIGPAVRSSLASAISRQLKPRWAAPQGAEAELLVTVLSWSLNADGSLAGKPQVVRQEGITDANRAQAARHAEQAVRAVELAAPFDLPAQYYDAWKRVSSFRFDRRLSQ